MPRYFFDIKENDDKFIDEDGVECSSDLSARREASRTMGEIAYDHIDDSDTSGHISMFVRDAEGTPLFHLAMSFEFKHL